MNRRYRVSVTEFAIEDSLGGREWKPTGEDDPKYAYTPEIIIKKQVEREIYHQDVEEICIEEIIKAVNY